MATRTDRPRRRLTGCPCGCSSDDGPCITDRGYEVKKYGRGQVVSTDSCCVSLDLSERAAAARFSIHCGPGKCARELLRGVA